MSARRTYEPCRSERRVRRRLSAAVRGFTLIEALASIVILATLGSGVAAVMLRGAETFSAASIDSRVHSQLSASIAAIDRVLREIPIRSDGLGPDLTQVTSSGLQWNTSGGEASLAISNGQLMLDQGSGSAAALMTGVTSLSVQAFDENNGQLTGSLGGSAVYPVRRLLVSVTASENGREQSLRCKVFLRCMALGNSP
jgi:prepilin-type N-terminal cleavage/methylation domain-containing protein